MDRLVERILIGSVGFAVGIICGLVVAALVAPTDENLKAEVAAAQRERDAAKEEAERTIEEANKTILATVRQQQAPEPAASLDDLRESIRAGLAKRLMKAKINDEGSVFAFRERGDWMATVRFSGDRILDLVFRFQFAEWNSSGTETMDVVFFLAEQMDVSGGVVAMVINHAIKNGSEAVVDGDTKVHAALLKPDVILLEMTNR